MTYSEGGRTPRSRRTPAPASYTWLFDLLFPKTPVLTWAAEGKLPDGFELAEQFAILPSGAGRTFMVSLAASVGSSSALTSYNALRPAHRRLARRALGLGLRTGLVQPLLRNKIDIGTAVRATAEQLAGSLLIEHLREVLGSGPVVIAFGGGAGPYRKPVLQVFSTNGTPLGYVKVGWNDWTRAAVRREAAALRTCAARPMRLGVPALLHQGEWRGLDLVVTAPLPRAVRRLGTGSRLPDASVLREISELSEPCHGELATSQWWIGLRQRIIAGAADSPARAQLTLAAERIQARHGRAVLHFGTWHGDLVPWNLARLGQRLYAWDWESSAPDAPVGMDAVHFHFQVAFVARQRSLDEAVAHAERSARPALSALGVAADAHRLITTLHLIELAVRHEEARSSAGDADNRFFLDAMRVLDQAVAPSPGAARLHSAGRPS